MAMTGDGAGNGWWSTAIPRDRLMKADLETQIGMGYLGAGKVAKLEFRSREELQRLKAETTP